MRADSAVSLISRKTTVEKVAMFYICLLFSRKITRGESILRTNPMTPFLLVTHVQYVPTEQLEQHKMQIHELLRSCMIKCIQCNHTCKHSCKWRSCMHILYTALVDFAVRDWWMWWCYCEALGDVKFSQIREMVEIFVT